MLRFFEKLEQAASKSGSLLCVGLDPDPALLPVADVAAFNRAVIEATAGFVCAYKPNLAFYEALGEAGYRVLRETLAAVPSEIPVIGDGKRGDIGNTVKAYARSLFDDLGFDAVTVNPYLGGDSLEPFLARDDKGVFILCRTLNPGARDLQDLPIASGAASRPLFEVVAEKARTWNSRGNVGLVAGATFPDELRRIRSICTEMTLLVPGVGAQGGDVAGGARKRSGRERRRPCHQRLSPDSVRLARLRLRKGGWRSGAPAPRRDRGRAGARPGAKEGLRCR